MHTTLIENTSFLTLSLPFFYFLHNQIIVFLENLLLLIWIILHVTLLDLFNVSVPIWFNWLWVRFFIILVNYRYHILGQFDLWELGFHLDLGLLRLLLKFLVLQVIPLLIDNILFM
mmetsp:Transcript_14521/g.14132  ORF Transcript_14521/g.14132 Transcript_14521/m.14132 type:complete len:116 (-) Transcript_14521:521-868(-)